MAGGRRIPVTVEADTDGDFDKAARGLDNVAKSGDKADASLRKLSKGHQALDAEINKVGYSLKALRSEFDRTGDLKLLPDLDKQQRTLTKLRGQMSKFGDDVAQDFSRGGVAAGSGLLRGVVSAFAAMPPQAQAGIALGVAGAIAAGSSFIGAAVTAAIVGGIGAGGLAIGIKLAANDPAVRAAWSDFAKHAGDQLSQDAHVFVQPLVTAAEQWKATFDRVNPSIERSFDRLAPSLEKLSEGAQRFVDKLSPGIEDAVAAARPVLDTLGKDLPGLGKDISGFFHQIRGDGESAAAGLHFAFNLLGATLTAVGTGLDSLTRSFGALDAVMRGSPTEAVARLMGIAGVSQRVGEVAAETARKVWEAAQKQNNAGLIAAAGWDAIKAASDRYFASATSQFNLDLALANVQFMVKDAVEQNGRTLDLSTRSGIANAEVIGRQIEVIKQWRDQQVSAKGDSLGLQQAVEGQVQGLLATADKYGLNRQKVEEWARAQGLVMPEVDSTANMDTTTAMARIGGLEQRLNAIDGRVTNSYANLITNAVTRVSTEYVSSSGGGRQGGAFAKGGIVEAARGLIARPGPLIKFAEPQTGGEALIPRRGIDDNRAYGLLSTAAAWHGMDVVPRRSGYGASVSPSGGGATVNITVNAGLVADGQRVGEQIAYEVRKYVRGVGGNVQVALGR